MRALVGLLDAGDEPQKHGLAGARRPEDGDDLSILDRERNPVEHLARLELLADRLELELAPSLYPFTAPSERPSTR